MSSKKILWGDDDKKFCMKMSFVFSADFAELSFVHTFNDAIGIKNLTDYSLLPLDGDFIGNGEGFEQGISGPDILKHWQEAAKIEGFNLPPVIFITSAVEKLKKRLDYLEITEDVRILDKRKFDPRAWAQAFEIAMK